GCFEADPALLRLDAPFARAGLSCAADAKCGRSEEENGYGHPRRTPAETGQHSLDDPVLEHGMAQSAGEMERYERQQGIAENSVRALENILVSLFVACRQIAQPGQQRKGRKLEKNGRLVRDRDHSPAGLCKLKAWNFCTPVKSSMTHASGNCTKIRNAISQCSSFAVGVYSFSLTEDTPYHLPALGIDIQGSAGASAGPF